MTWKQIRVEAEKRGLSCKQVYELVVAQKPSTNTGSPKLPTIKEVYKAIPFPEDERKCAMYVAGLADCLQYIVGRQLRAGA